MMTVVKIEKLDNFGRGMTYLNDKPLYIENAIDGESIEYCVTYEYKKGIEGVSSLVVEKSPKRAEVSCPYYSLCGGCNIMHLNYPSQLEFKKEKVISILKKFAGIDEKIVEDIIPTVHEGYRNKVTLKVNEKIGFYKRRTYEIVNMEKCVVASLKINEIIKGLNEINLKNIEEIVVRSSYNDESMVIVKTNGNVNISLLSKKLTGMTDNLIITNDKEEKVIFGKGYITEKLEDYYFKVSPFSFFQVNTNGAEKLYNKVLEYANLTGVENVLDLYCGTGTIGIFLSKNANSVTGIEINSDAVRDANENKKLNNVTNVNFINGDVGEKTKNFKNIDVVIMDPPRNGLNKKSLENLFKINPKRIVYVSCDPATLARDLNNLKDKYDVNKVSMVDMFPNTYHCESVTVLERR